MSIIHSFRISKQIRKVFEQKPGIRNFCIVILDIIQKTLNLLNKRVRIKE